MSRRLFLAVPCLLLAAINSADAPAAAQATSFCGGRLVADSVYMTIFSAGSAARADYILQLRNTTDQRVAFALTVSHAVPRVGDRPQYLTGYIAPWSSTQLPLGSQRLPNPEGRGATPVEQVRAAIHLECDGQ